MFCMSRWDAAAISVLCSGNGNGVYIYHCSVLSYRHAIQLLVGLKASSRNGAGCIADRVSGTPNSPDVSSRTQTLMSSRLRSGVKCGRHTRLTTALPSVIQFSRKSWNCIPSRDKGCPQALTGDCFLAIALFRRATNARNLARLVHAWDNS
jgi:hypothetical protein